MVSESVTEAAFESIGGHDKDFSPFEFGESVFQSEKVSNVKIIVQYKTTHLLITPDIQSRNLMLQNLVW